MRRVTRSASAIVDGVHFECYGNQSLVVVGSTLQLLAGEDPSCYMQTIIQASGGDPGQFLHKVCTLALWCLGVKEIGISGSQAARDPLLQILGPKKSSIKTFLDIWLADNGIGH